MKDLLILTVVVKGQNIMGNPLMTAAGIAKINGKMKEIKIETPITSIADFIDTFESLFKQGINNP